MKARPLGDDETGEFGGLDHVGEAGFDEVVDFFFDLVEAEVDEGGGDGAEGGEGLVGGFLSGDGGVVGEDAAVECFELDGLGGVVGGDADEFTAGQVGDLAGGEGEVELHGLAGGAVAAVGGDGGFLLEGFAEAFGDETGGVAGDLAADEVAGEVEKGVGLVAAVFFAELGEVLDAEGDGDAVLPGLGEGEVHAGGVEAGEFVEEEVTGGAAFAVEEFEHTGDIEADDGAVDVLFLRVGADTDDLGGMGVVEVEGEVVAG